MAAIQAKVRSADGSEEQRSKQQRVARKPEPNAQQPGQFVLQVQVAIGHGPVAGDA